MKAHFSFIYLLLTLLFCICLIVSNIIEIKVVDVGAVTITAGMVVFPISYIISDCIVEIYGFRRARLVIWLGFAMNLFVAFLLHVALWLPGSESWTAQEAMEIVFGAVPRIFVASFVAFICGSMVNAYVMSVMKRRADEKTRSGIRSFSVRAIISTLWGETIDSSVFFPIAFAGVFSWQLIVKLIVTQALLKTLYEVVILPVTIIVVRKLREIEGTDTVDNGDFSYKWWKVNEI